MFQNQSFCLLHKSSLGLEAALAAWVTWAVGSSEAIWPEAFYFCPGPGSGSPPSPSISPGLPDIGSYLQSGCSALEAGGGTVQGKA